MICHTGRNVLQESGSYWCVCIIGDHAFLKGMSYRWSYLTGVNALWEDMYYWKSFKKIYVLLEGMSNMRTDFTGWYILREGMY